MSWDSPFKRRKIILVERRSLFERMVQPVKRFPGCSGNILHMAMFPRHAHKHCKDHMCEDDVWMMDCAKNEGCKG
jgi:hypothetical protein